MITSLLKLTLRQKITYSILFLSVICYLAVEAGGTGDFHIYMSASADLFHGENIYQKLYGTGFHYLYSLFFAIILYPFTFLPFYFVKLAWLLLNAYLLYRTFRILFSYFRADTLSARSRWLFYALTLIFAARFIYENFHYGQVTILMLFCCVQGIHSIFYGERWWWGCILIALGINIKLLPVVLIPYLIYRGKFKAAALIILTDVVLWLVPVLCIGIEKNNFLLSEWWHIMNPSNTEHVLDVSERSFHSLTTLLSTLFVKNVPDDYALPLRRNLADVSIETLHMIILAVRLILVAGTAYFLRTWPFREATSKSFQFRELAYILALVPLIFPHQQHYAFLFIVPAAMFVWFDLISQYKLMSMVKRWFLIIGMSITYLCCNLKLILGGFNPYYEHYKILTYGALLLLILLASTPSAVRRSNALQAS
ncbi:MAG: DUF2029 domain-containing protein [Bacteroidetes bacterium]|nr:DUF2029 domain-containing protein [Bacteroidota bacterium]